MQRHGEGIRGGDLDLEGDPQAGHRFCTHMPGKQHMHLLSGPRGSRYLCHGIEAGDDIFRGHRENENQYL